MSTAFYPLGMSSYNNHLPQGGYQSWKGSGINSNPVGIASSNIRPLTNNDPGNVFPTGFGLARPIKHYRKGRVVTTQPFITSSTNPVITGEVSLINYNLNRNVNSSNGSSLGGGAGGRGLIDQMIDSPGSFSVLQNPSNEVGEKQQQTADCVTCKGQAIVANYYPNKNYLTNNPEPISTSPFFCCNEEKKARKRVLPASTNLKKNYYTTLEQYRENRCQTYDQRVFNFENYGNLVAKPGSPLSMANTYVANCQPNAELERSSEIALVQSMYTVMVQRNILNSAQIALYTSLKITTFSQFINFILALPSPANQQAMNVFNYFCDNPYFGMPITGPTNPNGCKLVVYKPNNPQFATQGAVSSSTRMLKLNVNTIQTNLAGYKKSKMNPFLYKNKSQGCNAQTQYHFQNKMSCI